MEKLIYLSWGQLDPVELGDRLLERAPMALSLHACSVGTAMGDLKLDAPAAIVSVWIDCLDRRGPFEAVLSAAGARYVGYLASESQLVGASAAACVLRQRYLGQ